MNIAKVSLINFRNFKKINLNFSKNINLLVGKNAQGKTSILESIYLLAVTKTFRDSIDENLINFNSDNYKISGRIKKHNSVSDYTIQYDREKKRVFVNDTEVKKISDYLSNINSIIFYPEDIDFIKDNPNTRRKIINIEISQLYNEYVIVCNKYNKILKIRNEYLKKIYINNLSDLTYFNILTDKLITLAISIYIYRYNFINEINKNLKEIYLNIFGEGILTIHYLPNINIEDFSIENLRKQLRSVYDQNYSKELMQGATIFGPHRDDFIFLLNDKEMKLFASQGQQRIAMIAFKLSEIKIIQKIKKDNPIILIDDIFNELDRKKKNKILELIFGDYQTIITTTELKGINKSIVKSAKIFEVRDGTVKEKGDLNEK
jgi:DNA replication and repair protein RecF